MNIKERIFGNRDYEFDAELENHPLGNQTKYRLYYIKYYRKDGHDNVGVVDWPLKPFMLPTGMSREEAFKILSYLTDFIEKKCGLEPCSYKSVAILDDVLNLERLGFKRVEETVDDSDIIDLFTVAGRVALFKKSSHYPKYFEWYMEHVDLDEVKEIYAKCGIQFSDLEESNTDIHPQFVKKKDVSFL